MNKKTKTGKDKEHRQKPRRREGRSSDLRRREGNRTMRIVEKKLKGKLRRSEGRRRREWRRRGRERKKIR